MFDKSKDPLVFVNDIKTGKISLEEAKNLQKDDNEYLNKIKRGNKNDEQKKTLANINIIFNATNNTIIFIEDYGSMILEARRIAKQRTGLKILTPKQILQVLPTALAEINIGNNSESLLNEIRQILFFLHQSKEITEKVYNNIIKSIKV